MNLLEILGKVGGSILADVVPGGNTILKVVNEFLDDDDKLPVNSTGEQVQNKLSRLPVDVQAQVLFKEFDVQIEEIKAHVDVTKYLGEVDKTGHSTRPEIAKIMAYLVAFTVLTLVSCIAVSIINGDGKTIKAIGENWLLIQGILGTPTALLWAYFGMRTKEKQQKYQAVSGAQPQSALSSIFGLFGKGGN